MLVGSSGAVRAIRAVKQSNPSLGNFSKADMRLRTARGSKRPSRDIRLLALQIRALTLRAALI